MHCAPIVGCYLINDATILIEAFLELGILQVCEQTAYAVARDRHIVVSEYLCSFSSTYFKQFISYNGNAVNTMTSIPFNGLAERPLFNRCPLIDR